MGLSKDIRAPLTTKSRMGLSRGIRAPLTIKSRIGLDRGMAWVVIKEASVTIFGWGIYKEINLGASSVFLKKTNPISKR